MRPVFNASLKTKKGTPSLNEASYCGINLMKDMNDLLMLFRTNHYVYLSDIRKAFLMIKLKKIEDRNRFCFFLREGDKLICYRFTTIIFGFNASPFILNYVIQYHASLFPEDECTDKVSAIKVGHTLFCCFLLDNTLNFEAFFHKNRYVCLFLTYKNIFPKKLEKLPKLAKF